LVRGARARWKIENETFNTLKNQGYHFEHNDGHENLSVVLAFLTMLAFLVDPVPQLCCPLFQATWKKVGSKRLLRERMRSHFWHFTFRSMRQWYEAILNDLAKEMPLPELDTLGVGCLCVEARLAPSFVRFALRATRRVCAELRTGPILIHMGRVVLSS